VEDANNAHTLDKFQMHQELLVLIDHLQFVIAPKDNLVIDILVSNAQQDKLFNKITHKHATLLLVEILQTLLDQSSITFNAEIVLLANCQDKFQTLKELNALTDLLRIAHHVTLEDQMMDIHAFLAQLDRSKIQTICNNVMLQFVMDNIKSNYQSRDLVEDAKNANGQDKFQITKGLLV